MTAISLIIHARQQPEHLDLCLASLYGQTHDEFEVLVVDAEPGDANDVVVKHHARHLSQPIRHIDAPGGAGNLAQALNAAILSTSAEYLVFFGGDCLAQPKFLLSHLERADYGYFVHGDVLPLDETITGVVDAAALGSGALFEESWLKSVSPEWHNRHLASSAVARFKDWLQKDTPQQQFWNNRSASCFRQDAIDVNGFDMDVEDWRIDRDFANRLQNNGLEPVHTRAAGNVLRLFSEQITRELGRGGRVPAALAPGGETRAVTGLEELMAQASAA
jgi:glycosyltransferase involved in cell wall biosynthesis